MSTEIYNQKNEHIATLLTEKEANSIAEALSFIAALPFIFFAFALQAVSEYMVRHMVLFSVIYFVLVALIGFFLYIRKKCKNRIYGMIAIPLGFTPLYLYICNTFASFATLEDTGEIISSSVSWLFVTVIVITLLVFVTAMAMLIKNGVWHLIISAVEVVLCLWLFL